MSLEIVGIHDVEPHRLAVEGLGVIAGRDHADLLGIELVEPEGRRGPADIDLARHHRGDVGRRPAHGGRLGGQVVLLDERRDDAVRRRAVGRVSQRLVVGILQRLDRRIRLHVPVQIAGASGLGADDAHRRAFGIGAEHAHDTRGDADIDAAGDDRLLRLAGALRVDHLKHEAVLLEDAGALADLRHRGVPIAALADGELHGVFGGSCLRCGKQRRAGHEAGDAFERHEISSPGIIFGYTYEHMIPPNVDRSGSGSCIKL